MLTNLRYLQINLLLLVFVFFHISQLFAASDDIVLLPTPEVKGLIFTSIKNGDEFYAGQKISVVIAKTKAHNLDNLGIRIRIPESGVIGVFKVDPEQLNAEIEIPKDILGPLEIKAMALDTNHPVIVVSDDIIIHIKTNFQLKDFDFRIEGNKVIDETYFINSIDPKQIEVVGKYSDGVKRLISDASTGTKYELLDPEVASVDSKGRIRAKLDGRTLLHVSNNGITKTTIINVIDVFGAAQFNFLGSPQKAYAGKTLKLEVKASNPQKTIPRLTVTLKPHGSTFVDHGDGTGIFTWTPSNDNEKYESVQFLATDPDKPEIKNTMTVDFYVDR